MGATLEIEESLIRDDPEALALWRKETTGQKHVHDDGDNVSIKDRHGNGRKYTLALAQNGDPRLHTN